MKTPAFRYQGGKARLRSWLIEKFPQTGNNYIEMFAGRGNVFFLAREKLLFQNWYLCDINIDFLRALREADLTLLPESVNREKFDYYRNYQDHISLLLEPRITFAGKGYKAGFNKDCENGHYKGNSYKKNCEYAKILLQNVNIYQRHFEDTRTDNLPLDDFIYLDPPYYNTKASYPNINHDKFLDYVNKLPCRWALSGYDNDLYQSKLQYKNKFVKEKTSEIKNYNERKVIKAQEVLWTNY